MTMLRGSGSGGGGGGKSGNASSQRTPTEAADSLFSTSYAKLIDLVSEGEIYGLKDGLKSIFIGNTPLQNSGGSYNFQNVSVNTRNGTQSQAFIEGFDGIANEVGVGVTVANGSPVIRSITDTSVDAVGVTITVPTLQQFQNDGDIDGSAIELKIGVSYNGGGFTDAIVDTIRGRTSQQYQKQYLISLDGAFPVAIRVSRVTAASTTAKLVNDFSWSSYTEVAYAKLSYPNSALVALRVNAEQFSSIPTRSYHIRGIKVKIPSNGTVNQTTGAISYSGTWDGTFGAAQWTSDPAWCLHDLLTSTRYGFGNHITASSLDKWSFYAASVYCSESVPDGFGGFEPRFSCNINIQTAEDAYKLINDMCSIFRAMPYWGAGALTINQDKPVDPAYLFTYANVSAEEGFSYSGSSLKTRPTVAVVQYQDLDIRDAAYEIVEDQAGITRYGVVKTEITAFGCTSRGQAHRIGEWLLYSAQKETEVCTFTASVDAGAQVRPGQVVEISDPMRAGARRGGRISSATTTAITVDDATGLAMGTGTTLSVILADGTVQARAAASISGTVITVSSAFSSAPNSNSVWMFETASLQSSTWRVLSVTEQDGCNYAISCLAYNSSKYDYIERGVPLQTRNISSLNNVPSPPTSLSLVEALYSYADQVRSKVIVTWQSIQGINQYLVKWRRGDGNWTTVTRQQQDCEIFDTSPGTYEIAVYSLSAGGQSSATSLSGSIAVLGKTAPPADVVNFFAFLDPDVGISLNWDPVADLDLQGYEIWQGSAWGSGIKIGLFAATSKKLGLPESGNTLWWIKALDTSGTYSTNATPTSIAITSANGATTFASFGNDSLILGWTPVSGSLSTSYYELRYGTTSTAWEAATPLGTVQGTTYSIKASWVGTRRFFIAAVDIKGNYGAVATYDAVVAAPLQPSITQQVVDNNVLLQWGDTKQTLPVIYYELRKGATWDTAVVIGTKQGRFTSVFETVSGTYVYWLAGVDSAGNYGTPGSVSAQVNQPPDYILKLNFNSTFTGTGTNVVAQGGNLFASVNTTETWQSHFTSRGWTTLQNQVSAGFAYYALPSQTSGQYYEDIDYGTVLAGTKVSATLTSSAVIGSMVMTPSIKTKRLSTDAWTTFSGVTSIYATNFRYVRVQYDFSSAGGDDLQLISGLNIRLDSKQRTDSGNGTANAADSGGTVVTFGLAFIDVDSISVTPANTSAVIAVYDFVDVPNPTTFKVLLFNTSGTRVSGSFSWTARGV
jgi:predicted phage tail protein